MRRSLIILACAALLSSAGSYGLYYGYRVSALPGDQAAWLRREFALSEAQAEAVARLERGYQPGCVARCFEYLNARKELSALTASDRAWNPEIGEAVERLYQVQMTCHREMLRHAYAVSAVMSPEQGRRYLAMIETRMSTDMTADSRSVVP